MENLILLHGALGSSTGFQSLQSVLQRYFTIHTFDFQGHGSLSKNTSDFGMEAFTKQLEHFIEENQLASSYIFGYSMGGYVALLLANRRPGLIKAIAAHGSKYLWTREYAEKETSKLNAEAIEAKVPQFARTLEERHGSEEWKPLLQNTKAMMQNLGEKNLLDKDALSDITLPVLVSQGDRDNTVSVEEAVEVWRSIPNAQLQIWPGLPHPFEKVPVEDMADSLINFFAKAGGVV